MRGPPSLDVREREGSAWWEGLMLRSRITGFSRRLVPALQPGITSALGVKNSVWALGGPRAWPAGATTEHNCVSKLTVPAPDSPV